MKALSRHELRGAQLRILDVFMRECDGKGLKYFLYYGSLIGAVRHCGIIPWDDDIDLAMPRTDYEKLAEIDWDACECELIFPRTSIDTPYLMAKVSDANTLLVDNIDCRLRNIGVSIDIFPLDYTDPQSAWSNFKIRILIVLKFFQVVKTIKLRRSRSALKNILLQVGKVFLAWLPVNSIVRLANTVAFGVERRRLIGSLLGPYGRRELMDPNWLTDVVKLRFEGRSVPAPSGYADILTNLYGQYMIWPPEDKRVSHHSFEAFDQRPAQERMEDL